MIWLLPIPPPSSPVSKLSIFLSLPVCRQSSLLTGEGGGWEKSNDGEKAWSSINHTLRLISGRYCARKNLQIVFEVTPHPPLLCLYGIPVPFFCCLYLFYLFSCCRAIFSITMLTVFSLLFSFQIFFHTFKVSVYKAWLSCSGGRVGFTLYIFFRSFKKIGNCRRYQFLGRLYQLSFQILSHILPRI